MATNQTATATSNSLTGTSYVLTSTNRPTPTYVGGSGYANSIMGIGPWSSQTGQATITAGTLDLSGDKADIKINDVSLTDTLKTIPERLNILVPNSKLEKEWDELKELGKQYRKLEDELAEKSRMWTALKKTE